MRLTRSSIASVSERSAEYSVRGPALRLDLGLRLLELVHAPRDEDRDAAGPRDLLRRRLADPARRARDDDRAPVDRALEGAVLEEVGVEVALPVVPDLVGVALERRDLDPRAAQRALGVARVELGGEPDVVEHLLGQPEVRQDLPPDVLQRRQVHHQRHDALGQRVGEALVDAHREVRGVRGLGEGVQHLARALRLRGHEVERLAVEVGLVGDVVRRAGDEVDRDDVRPAELGADEREPLRQHVARLLDELEEVVGPVDLVHLARARVADHDRGAVDPPRHGRLLAHDPLGLVLRAVVGRRQLLALVEHVLAEQALELAGDRDRRHVVQVAGLERVRELDRVARAADVQPLVELVGRGHVVDRGEVEEVLDPAAVLLDPRVVVAEVALLQVADDGLDALGVRPARDQRVELVARVLAHEDVHVALAVAQQLLDEMAPDEAGRAGHVVAQESSLPAGIGRQPMPRWAVPAIYTPAPAPPRPSPAAKRAAPAAASANVAAASRASTARPSASGSPRPS